MSDELDWELYDIFEAGLFPFPIYDHQTARRIIRYLLYRGVADEEIADAIEDSTADLHVWLNRGGKNMVGEWVIAWMNDVRDEYRREKQREARERGYSWHDYEMGSEASEGDDSSGNEGDDPPVPGQGAANISQADAAMRSWAERMRAIDDSNAESSVDGDHEELEEEQDGGYDEDQTDVKKRPSPSPTPPPLPPRTDTTHLYNTQDPQPPASTTTHNITIINSTTTKSSTPPPTTYLTSRVPLEYLTMHCSIDSQTQTTSSDISPRSHNLHWSSFTDEHFQQTPDSGAVSDIYSSIPPGDQRALEMMESGSTDGDTADDPPQQQQTSTTFRDQQEEQYPGCGDSHHHDGHNYSSHCADVTSLLLSNNMIPTCTQESHINIANSGLPSCPNCSCSLVHYSITQKRASDSAGANTSTTFSNNNIKGIMCNGQLKTSDPAQLNLYINEASSRVMDMHVDTLDRDGPGYIFIMTDSVQNFLPWSFEHRYKIASSRKPERWLAEFRARDIDVELIWQVQVRNHLLALRDVHVNLQRYNLHSNWFKCSLSKIMDVISRIVRKYRV